MRGLKYRWLGQCNAFSRPSLETIRSSVCSAAIALISLIIAPCAWAYQPGKDGALSVTTVNTVINTYTTLNGAATQNASTITVTSAAALTGLSVGDVLLIYNPQGASITTTNDATYGTISALNNAGRFEFVNVDVINGNTLTIDSGGSANSCGGGLRYNYDNGAEVVRVPQYSSLTISGAGSVIAQAWNGTTGGIVAAFVQNTATVGGAGISVAGQGFRGGALINNAGSQNTNWTYYVVNSAQQGYTPPSGTGTIQGDGGAQKGESIAGSEALLDTTLNGGYGRGAPANGGGGGDSHNAGGGGGANGDNGVTWAGEGNPDNSVATYTTAWNLDGTITSTHTDAGGGRGGYTYASATQDPTTTAPGNTAWGGNNRLERGGLGGRPLTNNPTIATARLYFGGGGGAGDENNSAGTAGGNGGGIVFLVAGTVTGTGTITANGASVGATPAGGNDGAGGGGGGGSIIVIASNSLSTVALTANGGAGGNQTITSAESEGGGGGGGGGYIAVLGGAPGSSTAAAGANGTSNSPGLEPPKFPPNGATKGSNGIANAVAPALSNFPLCNVPTLAIAKVDNGPWLAGQTNAQYTLTVKNTGSVATTGTITVLDTMPGGITPPATFTSNGWTCNFASPTVTCTNSTALAALGGSSTITVPVSVTAAAEPSVTNKSSVGGGGDPNNTGIPPAPGSCAAGDNHCGNDTTTVNAATAPTMTKSFNPVQIPLGGTSILTLNFTNPNANASLTGLGVSDTFPASMSVASPVTATNTCGGTFAPNAGDTSINLSGGALAASATCSISVVVTDSAAGIANNTTGVVSTNESGTGGTASATLTVVAPPTISKSFGASSILLNNTTSLSFTITNPNATASLTGVGVTDSLPSGLKVATPNGLIGSCGGGTITAVAGSGSVSLSGATLGASTSCTFSVNVIGTTAGTQVNTTGNVTSTNGGPGGTATATVTVVVPQLTVTKTASPNPFIVGQPASYTITVQNTGTATTTANITIADTLPIGITLATAVGTNWTCTGTTVLSCTFTGTLAVNASTVLTLNVNVDTTATTGTNSATASGGGDPTCPVAARCTGTTPTVTVTAPQLTVTKSASPNPFIVGQPASYTVTVQNTGTATTIGSITIADTLPTGITLATAVGTNWSCTGTTVLSCTFTGTLATSASTTLTLNVNVGSTATSGTNSATASGGGDPTCPATARCTGTTTTVNVTAPQLTVTKAASPNPFTVGQPASYTVTVQNTGTATTFGSITIADTLPTGITLATAVGTNWSCTGTTALSCTFTGTLAASVSTTLTLNVIVGATATSGTNSATASGGGDPTCPATSRCTGTTPTVPVNASADIALAKLVDNATPNVGDTVTFTVMASDLGPSDATGVAVTDALPSGLTFQSATPSVGSYNSGTGLWTIGNLANGNSETLTIVAVVTQPGMITNTATVTASNQFDPNTSNNSAAASLNATPSADVQVNKTVNNATPNVGSNVTFTITATNAGPDAATGVVITDLLPAGLSFVSAIPSGTTTYTSGTGQWNIGNLGNGGSETLTIVATVTQPGAITNTATKTAENEHDPVTANDQSGVTINGQQADIQVLKTVDNPNPNVGDTVTFTITTTNLGPSAATGVQVTDLLPVGLTLLSSTPSVGSYNIITGVWNIGGLAASGAGATATLTIQAQVSQSGLITNTASKTAEDQPDPNTLNDTGSASLNGNPLADVSVTKSGPPSVIPGNDAVYTITVTNNGPSDAQAVQLVDATPTGLTFVSATAPCVGGFPCSLGTVTNGQVITITVTYAVPPSYTTPDPILNVATATSSTPDPNNGNNTGTASTSVGAATADVSILKTGTATVTAGGTITYSLVIGNGGPSSADGATFTDPLPAGVTLVSAVCGSPTNGAACGTVTPTGNTVNGTVATLPPTGTVTIAITATAPNNAASLTNTATVSPPPGTTDPDPSDNSSSADTTVNASADLSVVKTGSATVTPGSNVSYTIAVTNNGPSDAQAVQLTDPTPTGLTFVSATAPCTGGFPCTLGTVTNGQVVTITVVYTVPANYAGVNPIVNTATVSSTTPDPTSGNNSSSANTNVGPGNADLAIVKSAPASVNAGASIAYTLLISNGGPSPADGATYADAVPVGITGVAASCGLPTGGATCAAPSVSGNNVTGSVPNLPSGGSVTITVTGVAPAAATTLTNTATVSPPANVTDPNTNNNQSSTDTNVVIAPVIADLALTKTGPAAIAPGNNVTYTITVTNNGPSDAQAVQVADPTPTGLTFVSATSPCAGGFPCTLGTVTNGQGVTFTVTYTVPANYAGANPIVNTATVSSTTSDSNPNNNTGSASTSVSALSADLKVLKTGPATVAAGNNITYTISVTNNGPDSATNTIVTDPAPAGLTFVSAGAPCSAGFPCNIGTLTNGQKVTISNVVFAVSPTYPGNVVVNVASASSDVPDPTPNNNSSTASTTINGTPPVTGRVPLDSRWMLLAMMALLAGVGAWRVRARRR